MLGGWYGLSSTETWINHTTKLTNILGLKPGHELYHSLKFQPTATGTALEVGLNQ